MFKFNQIKIGILTTTFLTAGVLLAHVFAEIQTNKGSEDVKHLAFSIFKSCTFLIKQFIKILFLTQILRVNFLKLDTFTLEKQVISTWGLQTDFI